MPQFVPSTPSGQSGNAMDFDRDRTLWCGNLHPNVTDELLYELFLQAGPVESVKIVVAGRNGARGGGSNYSFIMFKHPVSVSFAQSLMNSIRLFGQPLRLQNRNASAQEPIRNIEAGTGVGEKPSGVDSPDRQSSTYIRPILAHQAGSAQGRPFEAALRAGGQYPGTPGFPGAVSFPGMSPNLLMQMYQGMQSSSAVPGSAAVQQQAAAFMHRMQMTPPMVPTWFQSTQNTAQNSGPPRFPVIPQGFNVGSTGRTLSKDVGEPREPGGSRDSLQSSNWQRQNSFPGAFSSRQETLGTQNYRNQDHRTQDLSALVVEQLQHIRHQGGDGGGGGRGSGRGFEVGGGNDYGNGTVTGELGEGGRDVEWSSRGGRDRDMGRGSRDEQRGSRDRSREMDRGSRDRSRDWDRPSDDHHHRHHHHHHRRH